MASRRYRRSSDLQFLLQPDAMTICPIALLSATMLSIFRSLKLRIKRRGIRHSVFIHDLIAAFHYAGLERGENLRC